MNVTIVGIGVDGNRTLTRSGMQAIKRADFLIGAKRMVESVSTFSTAEFCYELNSQKIIEKIQESNGFHVVIVMSGDTGFHSGCKQIVDLLEKANEEDELTNRPKRFKFRIICGITSIQYLASKIKREWENVYLTSAHGTHCNILGNVLSHKETFFLTGGNITVSKLLKKLYKSGLGKSKVYIGECMGYPEERIIETTVEEGRFDEYHSISVVWVVRDDTYRDSYSGSIPDEVFIRGPVPITKQEVRGQIVSQIGRNLETVIYDVGAGTGSVAIELALANPMSQVYAFEVNPKACQLIRDNRTKLGAYNLVLVEGSAPESMKDIPLASKVFVGGSKGNMHDILQKAWQGTNSVDIVVSAIAVETFAQTVEVFRELGITNMEVTQIAVSKTKVVGDYHMLMGQNPIFLISGGRA